MSIIVTDGLVSLFKLKNPVQNGVIVPEVLSLEQPVKLSNFNSFITDHLSILSGEMLSVLPSEIMDEVQLLSLNILTLSSPSKQISKEISLVITTDKLIGLNSHFHFLPAITDVILQVTVSSQDNLGTWSASVGGTLTFGSGTSAIMLAVSFSLPSQVLSASLLNQAPLDEITRLLNFPEYIDPTQIISSMNLRAAIGGGNYNMQISLANVYKLSTVIDNKTFDLNFQTLDLFHGTSNGVNRSSVAGNALFNYNAKLSFDIYCSITNDSSTGRDIFISGNLSAGQGIFLSDFIDENEIPSPFKNIELSQLALSYSNTAGFCFQGMLSNVLQWDNNSFNLSFYYSRTTKSFTAQWNKTANSKFDLSSYSLGNIASFFNPQAASISFSVANNVTTALLNISCNLDAGGSFIQQPTLAVSVTKVIDNNTNTTTSSLQAVLQFRNLLFDIDLQKGTAGTTFTADYKATSGTVNLTTLLDEVLPYIGGGTLPPMVPSVECSALSLTYNSQNKAYSFSASSGQATTIDIANQAFDIDFDVLINSQIDPQTKKRIFSGSLQGKITLANTVFDVSYNIGTAKAISCYWKATNNTYIDFRDIARSIGIDAMYHTLPSEFDFELKEIALELNITTGYIKFSAITKNNTEAFFVANKNNGTWGFIFGVYIKGTFSTAKLPVIGSDLGALNFSVTNTCLLYSTISDPNFSLAQLGLPAIPNNTSLLGQNGPNATARSGSIAGSKFPAAGNGGLNLKPGLFTSFEVDLNGGGSPLLKVVKGLVSKNTITFCAELTQPFTSSFIEAVLGDPFVLKVGKEQISISKAALRITLSGAFMIIGSVRVPMGGTYLDASASLDISDTGIQFTFDIKNDSATGQPQAIPIPFGLKGLRLDEFGIEMGAIFVPPSLDLGLEGKFNIINQAADSDDFTIVISLEEELPNIDYFSGYIAQLDVKEVVVAATGDINPTLPDVFNDIKASDLSLYWCEEPTTLPDNTIAQAGFGFNGIIDIKGFKAHAGLSVSTTGGISGSAEMSPINLGPLAITGTGKGVTIKQENVNGNWIPLRKALPANSTVQTRNHQVVSPGGAFIEVSSHSSPYFDLSFQVSLFNFVREKVQAQIANTGLSFEMSTLIKNLYHCSLDCAINSNGFSAEAEFDLSIKVDVQFKALGIPIGPFHINTGFNTDLKVDITPNSFQLNISGDFHFDGFHLNMPTITLDVTIQSLEQLPGLIEQQILNCAKDIFKDIIAEAERLLDDAKKVGEDIEKGAVIAADAIKNEAEKAGQAIKQEADQIGSDLRQGTLDAERKISQIAGDTKAVVEQGVADVEKVATEVNEQIQHTVKVIENIPGEVKAETQKILGDAKQVAQTVAKDVVQLGEDLKKTGEAIAADAEKAGEAIKHEAEVIGNDLKQAAEQFASTVKTFVSGVFNDLAKIYQTGLKDIVAGFDDLKGYFDEVGPAIVDKAVTALKNFGNKVKDGFDDAGRAIGNFFSGFHL